jgi:hypothetical protein
MQMQPVASIQSERKERKMSTKTFIQPLQCNVSSTAQKACMQDSRRAFLPEAARSKLLGYRDIALDQIIEDPAEKDKGKGRFNFWNLLFPDHGIEAYRQLEGEDMTPIVVYKSANCYYIKDGGDRLAVARSLGKAFILAEVWECPCK